MIPFLGCNITSISMAIRHFGRAVYGLFDSIFNINELIIIDFNKLKLKLIIRNI